MNYRRIVRFITAFAMTVISVFSAGGEILTPEQALQRVRQQGASGPMRMPSRDAYVLTFTGEEEGLKSLYVFNSGDKGFIVTSADDRLPALLGYSDKGAFDLATAPPALKWWLEEYTREAVYFYRHEAALKPRLESRATYPAVEPLVKTLWNQDAPFNDDCPMDGETRSYTGCVATAMAQVIKYHNYAKGMGTHSYTMKRDEETFSFSYDYENADFDFSQMLDTYYDSEGAEIGTDEQRKAVANLMYACGVGVDMEYSSVGSGAVDARVAYALRTFFGYDKGARYLQRSYFSTTEWDELIYSELAEKRPVVYGGQANNGGHEFVCDGYDGDGNFHINWGWGGYCDGYFLLSLLNPAGQGIGGFAGGYNSSQTVTVGIQPPTVGTTGWYPMFTDGNMTFYEQDGHILAWFGDDGIYSFWGDPMTVEFALKCIPSTGGDPIYTETDPNLGFSFNYLSGWHGVYVPKPTNLAPGTYRAYLVFKTPDGEYQDVLFFPSYISYVNLTIGDDGKMTFEEGEPRQRADIEIHYLSMPVPIVKGEVIQGVIGYTNKSDVEYYGKIHLRVYSANDFSHAVTGWDYTNRVKFPAHQEVYYYLDVTFDENIPDGKYYLVGFDWEGNQISKLFPLTIGNYAEVDGITLSATSLDMKVGETQSLTVTVTPENATDKTVTWSSSDESVATVVDGTVTAVKAGTAVITATASNGMEATCTVTVTPATVLATSISLNETEVTRSVGATVQLTATVLPDDATDKSVTWSSSDGSVATVDDNGLVKLVGHGSAVITATTADGSDLSASCVVKALSNFTGIDTIIVEGARADVYSISGRLVKEGADLEFISRLESGVYIIKVAGKAYKIMK